MRRPKPKLRVRGSRSGLGPRKRSGLKEVGSWYVFGSCVNALVSGGVSYDRKGGIYWYVPYVGEKQCAFRDEIAVVDVVLGGSVRYAHGRDRVPPQELLADCIDVGQVITVLSVGKSGRADDTIDLLLCFLLDVWIQSHGQEEAFDSRNSLKYAKVSMFLT